VVLAVVLLVEEKLPDCEADFEVGAEAECEGGRRVDVLAEEKQGLGGGLTEVAVDDEQEPFLF
jgi:hypothetical protein